MLLPFRFRYVAFCFLAAQEAIQVGTTGIAISCKNVRKIKRAIDKKCMSGQARQS